jgi:hypothetical protein
LDQDDNLNRQKSIREQIAQIRAAQRAELEALPPQEAQALVDSILQPRLWRIVDPRQLEWPGDLADDDIDG